MPCANDNFNILPVLCKRHTENPSPIGLRRPGVRESTSRVVYIFRDSTTVALKSHTIHG